MAIMGETGGKWWSIEEGVGWTTFSLGSSVLLVEGINLLPVGEDFLLLLRELWSLRNYIKLSRQTFFC